MTETQPFDLAEKFSDPGLEKQLLEGLRARPGAYWGLADLLTADTFTEGQPEFCQLVRAIETDTPAPVDGKEAADLAGLAGQLVDLQQKRHIARLLQEGLQQLAGTPAADLLQWLDQEAGDLQNLAREQQAGRLVQLPEMFGDMLADLEARRALVQRGETVGIGTGIPALDNALGGLQPGLHLLAAEPGAGKTTLALQIGGEAAAKGIPVVFVSFEESIRRLTLKAICQRAFLEPKRFWDGYATPGDMEKLRQAIADHGPAMKAYYLLEGTSRLTVRDLKARALQAMAAGGTDRILIIVDYVQKWASIRTDGTEYRLRVNALTADLRELSQRLNCPVLGICSQNRAGQGMAKMNSLKESGDLEYSADTVMLLTGEDIIGNARNMALTIDKNRFGEKTTVNLIFKPALGHFAAAGHGY